MIGRLLLVVSLLLPSPALAAVALVGSADTGGTVQADTTITRSWTSTTGTNSAVVVFLPFYNGAGSRVVSSISWGSYTFSRISGAPGSPTSDDLTGEIWAAPLGASHTGATNTMTITFSGDVYCTAIIQQFDGVDQTTPSHDGGREATTNSGTASVTVANTASTDYLLGAFTKADGSNAFSIGSFTQLYQATMAGLATNRVVAMYRTGVTGSQAVSATFTSTYHGGAAAALQAASGGGGGGVTQRLMLMGVGP